MSAVAAPNVRRSQEWRRRRRNAVQSRQQSSHPGLRRPRRQPDGLRLPGRRLRRRRRSPPPAVAPIANNIVSLRAQYGRDTTATTDGIDTWDQTTPQQPTPADQEKFACLWARASAMRIAVVARNSQVDQGTVTAPAPVWAGSGDAAIDLSARPTGRITATRSSKPSCRFATCPGWPHVRLRHKPVPPPALAGQLPATPARRRPARRADRPGRDDAGRRGADSLGRHRQHHRRQPVLPRIGGHTPANAARKPPSTGCSPTIRPATPRCTATTRRMATRPFASIATSSTTKLGKRSGRG
ncbi:MAG: PilW family protein [Candidatus Accumulibacter sp.]|nr:PilW family protein [Candidatus Accumulibacter propinquus]